MGPEDAVPVDKLFDVQQMPDGLILYPKRSAMNFVIFDPGMHRTATCRSGICEIDPINGKLTYRGTLVEELADKKDFMEVAAALIVGTDCDTATRGRFTRSVRAYFDLHPTLKDQLAGLPDGIHPMDFLTIGLLCSGSLESEYLGTNSTLEQRASYVMCQTARIVAEYRRRGLKDSKQSAGSLDHAQFAQMFVDLILSDEAETSRREKAHLYNKLLILHAEHDQNCSTTAVRCVASAGGDLYAALAAGIAAFKGPLHGGASQVVPEMLEEFIASGMPASSFIAGRIKSKVKLMGFGHRLYRCWDPRARYMRDLLIAKSEMMAPAKILAEAAIALAEAAESDEFLTDRKILPNPDLFNCIFFRLLDCPPTMNAALLCTSRVAGWIAHYYEAITDRSPIMRPRQVQKRIPEVTQSGLIANSS